MRVPGFEVNGVGWQSECCSRFAANFRCCDVLSFAMLLQVSYSAVPPGIAGMRRVVDTAGIRVIAMGWPCPNPKPQLHFQGLGFRASGDLRVQDMELR